MKTKLLLLLAVLLCAGAPLMAQTTCFERNANMAQKFYEKGNFEKAKEYCTKALQCEDADSHSKDKSAIANLLKKCNEKLNPSAHDDNGTEEKPVVRHKKASYLTVNGNKTLNQHVSVNLEKKEYTIMTDGSSWSFETTGDFITAQKKGKNTLSVTIGQNANYKERKGSIVITADEKSATINFSQDAPINTTPRVEVTMVPSVDIKQNKELKNGSHGLIINLKANYLYLKGKQVEVVARFVDAGKGNKKLYARDSVELYAASRLVIPQSDAQTERISIELDYELLAENIKEGTLVGIRIDAINTQGRTFISTNCDIDNEQKRNYYTFTFSAKQPTATMGDGGTNSTIANNVRVEQNYYVSMPNAENATGRGLRFSTAYTMFNMTGHRARFAILFYDLDGQPIIDHFDTENSMYLPAMGIRQVAAIGDIEKVKNDNVLDTNHQFIAYRQLPINKAAPNMFKYKVAIFDMNTSTPTQLYESDDFGTVTFTPEERDIYRYLFLNDEKDTLHITLPREDDYADTLRINTNYDVSMLKLYGMNAKEFKWKITKDNKGVMIRPRKTNKTDAPITGTLILRVMKSDTQFLDEVVIEIEQLNTHTDK